MNLRELQRAQQKHDEEFHRDVISWDRSKQVEHCVFHLAKLTGLFSTYCEKMHHGETYDVDKLVADRIPDILIFALKFANLWGIDLEKSYFDRLAAVEARRKL